MEEDVLLKELEGQTTADGEPTFLPPFANAENRALDAQIQSMEQQLQQVDLELEENAGRVGIMDDHMKNVQQEITYAQHRVEAEKREIETEDHLKLMADKETARIRNDMVRLERQRQELSDRVTSLQASIFKGSEKLDQFKLLMNWNQDELDQWALAQQQKEEDNQALDKYRCQDEGKLQQLSLAIEKLTQQVAAQKAALEAEITDTQAAQIQLDRAAQDFRQLHQERQGLIRQWDEARDAMKSRDEAIQAMATAYAERKVLLKQRQAELDAQARFLAGEIANNREFEAQIVFYDREMARARELQAAEAAKLEELVHHVDLMHATLSKAANDLAAANNNTQAAQQELETRRTRLEAVRKQHAALKQQLEGQFDHLDSLEAKVSELEAMRKREEVHLKALQKEHQQLKKEQFKSAQALHALRQAEKELISDIAGGQGQAKNLAARQKALDEQLQRQGELMYAVDFNLQEMEHRIARAGGHRSDDEARALNVRIADLSQLLETVSSEHSMLTTQMKQAELDLSDARRTNGAATGNSKRLLESIQALQLETSSVARALKDTIAAREKQLVEHDVLKLQVQRLRDVLSMHADDVYSLESRKVQLKLSLDERRHEIEVHRDSLRAELRLVRDDIHRVTLELRDRQTKVDVLHAKFETLASRIHGTDTDGGEPKSQAYYIVKAAQEREELRAAGDVLDAKITQCEAEVEALTNTLSQMQATTSAFASSLRYADSEATQETQRALRDQLDASYDKLKGLRQQEALLLAELQQQQASASSSAAELEGLQSQVDDLARRKAEAEKQLEEQQEKQARALKALGRAQKLLATHVSMAQQQRPGSSSSTGQQQRPGSSASSGTSSGSSSHRDARAGGSSDGAAAAAAAGPVSVADAEELEADVQLSQLRLVMKGMLQELRALDTHNPEAGIAAALTAAGFKLPSSSTVPSRCSSRTGSKAGSLGRSQSSAGHSMDGASTKASSVVSSGSRNKISALGLGKIASVKNISFG